MIAGADEDDGVFETAQDVGERGGIRLIGENVALHRHRLKWRKPLARPAHGEINQHFAGCVHGNIGE